MLFSCLLIESCCPALIVAVCQAKRHNINSPSDIVGQTAECHGSKYRLQHCLECIMRVECNIQFQTVLEPTYFTTTHQMTIDTRAYYCTNF